MEGPFLDVEYRPFRGRPEKRWPCNARSQSILAVSDAPPDPQLGSILPAQLRHKTGEIRIPPEAQTGDYDLVLLASPTWWFQTSMPIRSYLASPGAMTVLSGKPFACASISRRYYSINLRQMKKLGERNGGRSIDKTHFVVAGGQVKSMLSRADHW